MHRVLTIGCWLLTCSAWVTSSCDSSYPTEAVGGMVRGTLFYDGAHLSSMNHPSAGVYAFARMPPVGPPHGVLLIDQPAFPVSYELSNLEPWSYFVVAQLIDLKPDAQSDTATPRCLASGMPPLNPVRIRKDTAIEDIDLTLEDADGSDPTCGGY